MRSAMSTPLVVLVLLAVWIALDLAVVALMYRASRRRRAFAGGRSAGRFDRAAVLADAGEDAEFAGTRRAAAERRLPSPM